MADQDKYRDDIEQFKFISMEKQSPGLKRSITTAAFLAVILPIFIYFITNIFPYIEYPIQIDETIEDNNNTTISIVNKGKKVVDSMIINLDYANNYLLDYSISIPDFSFSTVFLKGKKELNYKSPNISQKPFRGYFKVENLSPEVTIKLTLTPLHSNNRITVANIVRDKSSIVSGDYAFWKSNTFYITIGLIAIIFFIWRLILYIISWKDSLLLEKCLNIIVSDLANGKENPEWFQQPLETLFDYWKKLRINNQYSPKELNEFLQFLRDKNMILEELDKGTIWIAPFDVLGSPTFTKLMAFKKKAILIKLDDKSNVIDTRVESCGKLLQK